MPSLREPAWQILSAEYPPRLGGVAAYTERLARALAAAGVEVQVWTSGTAGTAEEAGITVHRGGGTWQPRDFRRLATQLDCGRTAGPCRWLVQFTPNAWHPRGLNHALGRWLWGRRRRGDEVRVMFHELWYFPEPGDPPRRWALSLAQRGLATLLVAASTTCYVAIPEWGQQLTRLPGGRARPMIWLPIPSNIEVQPLGEAPHRIPGLGTVGPIIGHFGTFSGRIGAALATVLPAVLAAHPHAGALLIGINGEQFVDTLRHEHPEIGARVHATGALSEVEVSRQLQGCDLLLQPYPGGVSSRRSSVMAGLVHGLPVVTDEGPMTEPVWRASAGVALAAEGDVAAMVRQVGRLLADPAVRHALGVAGRALYDRQFRRERVVATLLGCAAAPVPC